MSEHVNSYFCKCAWVFLVVHVYICIHTYLLHSALYTYDMYVYIYIYAHVYLLWNQHLGNQAQKNIDERRQFAQFNGGFTEI